MRKEYGKRVACFSGLLVALTGINSAWAAQLEELPKTGWRLHYADSAELIRVNRPATDAFDNRTSSFWFTEWWDNRAQFPHEIQIDLGDSYPVAGFKYLPRQDENHGRIKDYEFYVSNDGVNWGSPVTKGSFVDSASAQGAQFSSRNARYIRLKALNEVEGRFFASVAELDVLVSEVSSGGSSVTVPDTGTVLEPIDSTPTSSPIAPKDVVAGASDDPISWSKVRANAVGKVYIVASEAAFNEAANSVGAGDVVVVRNGTYSHWNLNIPSRGTASQPVIYTAETPGGVTFSGGARMIVTGQHNLIGGFVFRELTQNDAVLFDEATDNRFTDNKFYDAGGDNYFRNIAIRDDSHRNRVDHNLMQRNRAFGIAIVLPKDGENNFGYSYDNRIDHNVFRDIYEGNGKIALQIGAFATDHGSGETRSIVEHNEFINVHTTNVNSKGNAETYRYNRFINSEGDALALRSGNDKHIEGNYFENVNTPIRAYGTGHVIVNNVIVNAGTDGIQIPKWGDYQLDASGRTSPSGRTGDMVVAYNTIVNAGSSAIELGRTWGFIANEGWIVADNPPFNVKIHSNVMVGGGGPLLDNRGAIDEDIRNNVYQASSSADVGDTGSNAKIGDARLSSSYRPGSGSVAIGAGLAVAGVALDAAGIKRTSPPDAGAYQH